MRCKGWFLFGKWRCVKNDTTRQWDDETTSELGEDPGNPRQERHESREMMGGLVDNQRWIIRERSRGGERRRHTTWKEKRRAFREILSTFYFKKMLNLIWSYVIYPDAIGLISVNIQYLGTRIAGIVLKHSDKHSLLSTESKIWHFKKPDFWGLRLKSNPRYRSMLR